MPDPVPDALELELIELGRSLVTPPPREDLATRVLAQLAHPPVTGSIAAPPSSDSKSSAAAERGPWFESRRRRLVGAMAAAIALLVVALVPPVRAAVLELLRIGGVIVREVPPPSPAPPPTPGPPTSGAGATMVRTLDEAGRLVGFDVAGPTALGEPSTIAVSHDGRVVEMTWGAGDGSTRLDVFVGSLSWGYLKSVWNRVTPTEVAGHDAVWFDGPHLIEWIDREGTTHAEPARLAGPTLVWVVATPAGELTHRLEGPSTLDAASAIAETVP